jgi:hypothetical protein
LFFKNEKHATRQRPDGFCLESFRANYFFYKVRPCTLPFRPAKAVPYLSGKYGQQQKISHQKMPPLLKFLTAQNGLFLGRYECIPSSFTQMTSLSFAPKISHFELKL